MKRDKLKKILSEQLITISTLASVVLGVVVGLILRNNSNEKWSEREVMYIKFVGEIFLRILKGLTLPLIISSLIAAIGSLNLGLSGKIGARAVIYYLCTTFLAVSLGILLVLTIQPGVDRNKNVTSQPANHTSLTKYRKVTTTDTMLDLFRNMFPPNIVQACIEQYQTVLTPPNEQSNSSKDMHKLFYQLVITRLFDINFTGIDTWRISNEYTSGMNIMGLVVSAIACGIAMSTSHGQVQHLLGFVNELSQMMMKITGWVICFSPVGIFSLTVSQILEMDDLNVVVGKLGLFLLTVSGGLIFQGVIILPVIYYLFTKQNPYIFMIGMGQAIATAFGTASSSATLPVSIQCLEEKNKVNSNVARFMMPIGATINMDGTALYEAVASIFIAQLRGIKLSFGKVVAVR